MTLSEALQEGRSGKVPCRQMRPIRFCTVVVERGGEQDVLFTGTVSRAMDERDMALASGRYDSATLEFTEVA